MITAITNLILPVLFFVVGALMVFGRRASFETFLVGAEKGLHAAVSLVPVLVGLVTVTTMLRASGFLDILARLLQPLCTAIGMDASLLPLILLRPVSGSASMVMLQDVFTVSGPDSIAGITASVLLGSSETLIYVMTVYFGAVRIKKTRHTLFAAFLTMVFSVVLSLLVCRLLF